MSIANYTELKAKVADWLNRVGSSAIAGSSGDFITLAEAAMNRDLRVRQMVKRATATLDAGYITLPSDYLEAKNVQLNIGGKPRQLEFMTMEQADDYRASDRGFGIPPRFYTTVGSQLEVVATIDGEAEIELAYYAKIPALSDSNQTNWLLTLWPDLYLYGALIHSAPYLRDDQRVLVWQGLYDKGLQSATLADQRATYSGSTLKTRSRLRTR
jgi:hypothetical protein